MAFRMSVETSSRLAGICSVSSTELRQVHTEFHEDVLLTLRVPESRTCAKAPGAKRYFTFSVKLCVHSVKLCVRLSSLAALPSRPRQVSSYGLDGGHSYSLSTQKRRSYIMENEALNNAIAGRWSTGRPDMFLPRTTSDCPNFSIGSVSPRQAANFSTSGGNAWTESRRPISRRSF